MDLLRNVMLYGLLAVGAVLAVLLVAAGLMQGLVRVKKALGGDTSGLTKAEREAGLTLDEAKAQRAAETAAKKAELQAKYAEMKARRRSA